jgi:hypothetical protein
VFLLLLLKVGAGLLDGEDQVKKDLTMPYQRVLALEALRGLVYQLTILSELIR